MYFVVFILQTRQNQIVPYSWIKDLNEFIERFINNGVNSNIDFEVFWTHRSDAFDQNGLPRSDYPTNPTASKQSQFPFEGWYPCRIRKFRGRCNIAYDLMME